MSGERSSIKIDCTERTFVTLIPTLILFDIILAYEHLAFIVRNDTMVQ
jgi:hypothetical protein